MRKIILFFSIVFLIVQNSYGQLEADAKNKIEQLKVLISEAETLEINVLQEKMTIRVAEVFLEYANWDEENVSENTNYFTLVARYKNNAAEMAQLLPDFERNEIVLMLDEAIETINHLKSGEITRSLSPKVDWGNVSISGNKVIFEGKPVFLEDYTWKPKIEKLTECFGNRDGVFMTPNDVINTSGSIKSALLSEINGKTDGGTFGSIFLNHKNVPNWAETAYGPGFKMREDTYTAYDIDNPGARELQGFLLGGTVPLMADKKYADLGYMLCNEPHFFTTSENGKNTWASGSVSEYTKVKFRDWLKTKHTSISELNELWGGTLHRLMPLPFKYQ